MNAVAKFMGDGGDVPKIAGVVDQDIRVHFGYAGVGKGSATFTCATGA